MGKNFDTIDIFFIMVISIYLIALIIFITIFLIKYFEVAKDEKIENINLDNKFISDENFYDKKENNFKRRTNSNSQKKKTNLKKRNKKSKKWLFIPLFAFLFKIINSMNFL